MVQKSQKSDTIGEGMSEIIEKCKKSDILISEMVRKSQKSDTADERVPCIIDIFEKGLPKKKS